MEPEEGGLTVGSMIAIFGAIMFIAYIGYRISLQREELRDTIRLITDEHDHFIDDLQAMVHSGAIHAVSGNS